MSGAVTAVAVGGALVAAEVALPLAIAGGVGAGLVVNQQQQAADAMKQQANAQNQAIAQQQQALQQQQQQYDASMAQMQSNAAAQQRAYDAQIAQQNAAMKLYQDQNAQFMREQAAVANKQPSIEAAARRGGGGSQPLGGPGGGGTMLTGPMGVDPSQLALGKNTLLGG